MTAARGLFITRIAHLARRLVGCAARFPLQWDVTTIRIAAFGVVMLTSSQEKAIRSFVLADVGDDIKRLIRLANWDLYYGPGVDYTESSEPIADDGETWPGFSKACREIRDALDVGTLYIDDQSDCVSDREPECQCDNREDCDGSCCNDWYSVEPRDVLSIVVGKELAPYVR
jgi:hypothetical protein